MWVGGRAGAGVWCIIDLNAQRTYLLYLETAYNRLWPLRRTCEQKRRGMSSPPRATKLAQGPVLDGTMRRSKLRPYLPKRASAPLRLLGFILKPMTIPKIKAGAKIFRKEQTSAMAFEHDMRSA